MWSEMYCTAKLDKRMKWKSLYKKSTAVIGCLSLSEYNKYNSNIHNKNHLIFPI